MTAGRKRYIKRGINLDIALDVELEHGVYFGVEIRDKAGKILEAFEFRFDEDTVREWIAGIARQSLRSLFRR